MPKATKDVNVSLKSKPKTQEPTAKRNTKNNNKDKALELKAEKNPNSPKRPLSAYLMYCADMRDEVKKESPSAAFSKFSRVSASKYSLCLLLAQFSYFEEYACRLEHTLCSYPSRAVAFVPSLFCSKFKFKMT